MAYSAEKIENGLGYMINPKKAKRTSHKNQKKERNRKQRRKIKANPEFTPEYDRYNTTEF